MAEYQSSRLLAVILGASYFPDAPKLAEGRAFYISAADIKEYLADARGLAIPRRNIFSLFDDSRSPTEQLMEIAKFLVRRAQELKSEDVQVEDLLVYYVGHGLFTRGDQTYCLAVRSTNEINEGASSIRSSDLASVIKENAAFLRRYLILDCCFSASIYKEFQSGPLNVVRANIRHELPGRGTALLCSSNAREASLAPQGLEHTMFSNALIKALRQGHPSCGPRLSFSELGDLVQENLRNAYPQDWVRPEVHSPDQREGDIADLPLFPNAAYEAQRRAGQQAILEEEQRAAAAAEQAARRKADDERLERENAEAAETARIARQRTEQERQAREEAAQAQRLAAERADHERRAQHEAEAKRLEAQRTAAERAARQSAERKQWVAPPTAERAAVQKIDKRKGAILAAAAIALLALWSFWPQGTSQLSQETPGSEVAPPVSAGEQPVSATSASNSDRPAEPRPAETGIPVVSSAPKVEKPPLSSTAQGAPETKEAGTVEDLSFTLRADLSRLTQPFPGCSKRSADGVICGHVLTTYKTERGFADGEDTVLIDNSNGRMWLFLVRRSGWTYQGSSYFDDRFTKLVSSANSRNFLGYDDWQLPSESDVRALFGYWNKQGINVYKGLERDLGWYVFGIAVSNTCTSKRGPGFAMIFSDNQRRYCYDKSSGESDSERWGINEALIRRATTASAR